MLLLETANLEAGPKRDRPASDNNCMKHHEKWEASLPEAPNGQDSQKRRIKLHEKWEAGLPRGPQRQDSQKKRIKLHQKWEASLPEAPKAQDSQKKRIKLHEKWEAGLSEAPKGQDSQKKRMKHHEKWEANPKRGRSRFPQRAISREQTGRNVVLGNFVNEVAKTARLSTDAHYSTEYSGLTVRGCVYANTSVGQASQERRGNLKRKGLWVAGIGGVASARRLALLLECRARHTETHRGQTRPQEKAD